MTLVEPDFSAEPLAEPEPVVTPVRHRDAGQVSRAPGRPPGQDELPDSDDIPMETPRHKWQMELLSNSLEPWLMQRAHESGDGGYVGGNMFVYFSPEQVRTYDFRGPDFFVVLGTDSRKERKSWVVWNEGKGPDVIVELMSESTSAIDKTVKKDIYQDRLRVPEYYWFDPFNPEDFAGFALCTGAYKPLAPDDQGRLTSDRLGGLRLGPWRGTFHGIDTIWLRWYTADGTLLLTAAEAERERADAEAQRADAEAQRADAEAERADAEARRADELASKLRALGLDPDASE